MEKSLIWWSKMVIRVGIPCKHSFLAHGALFDEPCSHLHGHKFWIVGRSLNYTSNDPTLNPPIVEGQENPMRRDTIVILQQHSATLRFVANNPGAWLFHCESSNSIFLINHTDEFDYHQVTLNGTLKPVSQYNL